MLSVKTHCKQAVLPPNIKFLNARVTRRVEVTDRLFKLWLKPSELFQFKPGQYCTVGLNGVERPYSIVSAPDEVEMELFISLIDPPRGVLTPPLHKLKEGDEVTLRPRAKGLFVFNPQFETHIMVSTVTGVAPFVSMLRALRASGDLDKYNIHILQGASYLNEFAYDDELWEFANKFHNLHYVPTVSRPTETFNRAWTGETGRVDAIAREYLKKARTTSEETLFYACGNPGMVDDMRAQCLQTDIKFTEERFWKE